MPLWTARRLSVVAFLTAGLLFVAVGWFSIVQMQALQEARDLVIQTLVVREEIEIVLSLLKDAETSERGFLITIDDQYLAPYHTALRHLPTRIARLRGLTNGNPRQQAHIDEMEPLIAAKLSDLAQTIDVRRTRSFDAVQQMIRTNSGKRTMDRIRAIAAAMQLEETRLYDERAALMAQRSFRASIANLTALILAAGLIAGATVLLTRANQARDVERSTRELAERLAAARLESETRLRVTLESIGDAVIATDARDRVTLMNPVAQALTGWTEAEARGRPLEDIFVIVDETSRQPVQNPANRVLRKERSGSFAQRTLLIARDGRDVPIDDSAAPIRDTVGRIDGVVIVFRDVTAQRSLERQRALMLEREQTARLDAEAATRAKDEFVATLSHELRTPLNALFGWVRVLKRGRLDAESRRKALDVIERNTRTQAQLIEDLLDVSRVITGKLHLEMRAVKLSAVVDAAVDIVRAAAGAKGVRINVHADARTGVVAGDPDRLQQVVWNLLTNAIRFTPDGGRIDVYVEPREEHEEIRVTDTGRGIAPSFLPYVFDRFRQADPSAARTHSGLGIGLSLVRHLTEMHGGTVSAHSDGEGHGATLTIRLPRRPSASGETPVGPASRESQLPSAETAEHLAGLRVLVVDDDADARDVMRLAFEQAGARVTLATSAAEALATFERAPVDALVSDIAMPGKDGYELIKALRASARGAAIPAVALTAYAHVEDRERALKAGFQLHVAKPIDPAAVVRAVALVARRSAAA
jgi:PAS domain S-box-containing protein